MNMSPNSFQAVFSFRQARIQMGNSFEYCMLCNRWAESRDCSSVHANASSCYVDLQELFNLQLKASVPEFYYPLTEHENAVLHHCEAHQKIQCIENAITLILLCGPSSILQHEYCIDCREWVHDQSCSSAHASDYQFYFAPEELHLILADHSSSRIGYRTSVLLSHCEKYYPNTDAPCLMLCKKLQFANGAHYPLCDSDN